MREIYSINEIKKQCQELTQGCLNPQIVIEIPDDPWDFMKIAAVAKCEKCEVCKKKKGNIKNV